MMRSTNMRHIALAAALAAALSLPAFAADSVTGVIETIDAKERVLTLDDGTKLIIGKDVDLGALKTGTKVVIDTRVDEDGHTAATAVTPVQ